jgi:hypothetical protein
MRSDSERPSQVAHPQNTIKPMSHTFFIDTFPKQPLSFLAPKEAEINTESYGGPKLIQNCDESVEMTEGARSGSQGVSVARVLSQDIRSFCCERRLTRSRSRWSSVGGTTTLSPRVCQKKSLPRKKHPLDAEAGKIGAIANKGFTFLGYREFQKKAIGLPGQNDLGRLARPISRPAL